MTKKEFEQIKKALDKLAERMVESLDKYQQDIQKVCKGAKDKTNRS